MITIREYVRPASLEEAWTLNQKRTSRVIGGMLWLKMQNAAVGTAIDLSGLGLDKIEETPEGFAVGAMVSLRALETHAGLNEYTNGAMREALRHIVGVQFRNTATLGGSVYGRFGFSDVLAVLLALNASVELYKGGSSRWRSLPKCRLTGIFSCACTSRRKTPPFSISPCARQKRTSPRSPALRRGLRAEHTASLSVRGPEEQSCLRRSARWASCRRS